MRLSLVIYDANLDDDVIAVVLKVKYLVTGPLWKLLDDNVIAVVLKVKYCQFPIF